MDSQEIELAKPTNPFNKLPIICDFRLVWCDVICPAWHNSGPQAGGREGREGVKLHVIQRPIRCY